ncbi:kinase-like domain-containing protein [Rhizophagus irregularis DAOM 181602=DAOM 197198]|nr:kinase-like domain-containing protein [Rhizophagus irregularis DAOM 181602=DAOM 197198]
MIYGLGKVHERGLIHRDFHSGNMINVGNQIISITDLGLCRPMNAQNNDTYGVLLYVAPEICKQAEEADEINKDLPSLTALLSNTNTLSYTTHPQAIYTSRILDFIDLPESNLINLRIDFEDENN